VPTSYSTSVSITTLDARPTVTVTDTKIVDKKYCTTPVIVSTTTVAP
jgi:hypothetical protein